jgi:NAD(P)-dependent dehydrogenase (short-subunit alcohol dehydrogenase family)
MKAIVTGASSGIGRAVCQRLLEDGFEVVGLGRDPDRPSLDRPRFGWFQLDLADLNRLPDRLGELVRQHPAPEALICCAGAGRFGDLEQFSYAQIRGLIDLNFTGHAFLVRAYLPALKRAGAGTVVFIGSEAALHGTRKGAVYCASKFALRGFAQALRQEGASAGVRVTLINPGMVRTPFFDELDFGPSADPDTWLRPEEVALTVTQVLATRPGVAVDEVNLTPLKRVIEFGAARKGREEDEP